MTPMEDVFDSEGPFQLEVIDPQARPDQAVESAEVLDLLNKEINELSPLYREVVVMRYPRQREIGDIAADLGISVPAAKSRLMRARIELKGRLDDHYGGTGCVPLLHEPDGSLTTYSRRGQSQYA